MNKCVVLFLTASQIVSLLFVYFSCQFGFAGFNCNDCKSATHYLLYCSSSLSNIHESVCNANFYYSESFGCGCGVCCVGFIADYLHGVPYSCKLQVGVKHTFSRSIFTNIPWL